MSKQYTTLYIVTDHRRLKYTKATDGFHSKSIIALSNKPKILQLFDLYYGDGSVTFIIFSEWCCRFLWGGFWVWWLLWQILPSFVIFRDMWQLWPCVEWQCRVQWAEGGAWRQLPPKAGLSTQNNLNKPHSPHLSIEAPLCIAVTTSPSVRVRAPWE